MSGAPGWSGGKQERVGWRETGGNERPETSSGMCTDCTGQSATSRAFAASDLGVFSPLQAAACDTEHCLRTPPLWHSRSLQLA